MRLAGMDPQVGPWSDVAIIDLAAGWDAYWSSRPRRWRKNIRRCERKLADAGRVSYVRHRPRGMGQGDDDPRWDLYDACEYVASRSWQARAGYGNTLSHAAVRPFLREAHAAAAAAGAADVSLLSIDDRPVAFAYCYVRAGRVIGLRMGYDESESRDGAGSVLLARMIEDSCLRGDTSLNLGSGYLDCKRYWQTTLVRTQRCTWYAPSAWRAQAIRFKRAIQARLGEAAGHRDKRSVESY
jgi:CelD/BcsL family acetyltransferase involved in cellulose biosynthesis